jgi:hypothetical protein
MTFDGSPTVRRLMPCPSRRFRTDANGSGRIATRPFGVSRLPASRERSDPGLRFESDSSETPLRVRSTRVGRLIVPRPLAVRRSASTIVGAPRLETKLPQGRVGGKASILEGPAGSVPCTAEHSRNDGRERIGPGFAGVGRGWARDEVPGWRGAGLNKGLCARFYGPVRQKKVFRRGGSYPPPGSAPRLRSRLNP